MTGIADEFGEKCREQDRIDALAYELAEVRRGLDAVVERLERVEREVLPREPGAEWGHG
jgi:hypothetical protein